MTVKAVGITLRIPDDEGNLGNVNSTCNAWTDDDGATIHLPNGYLPGLAEAPVQNVDFIVIQPFIHLAVQSFSVVVDPETGDQTITTVPASQG